MTAPKFKSCKQGLVDLNRQRPVMPDHSANNRIDRSALLFGERSRRDEMKSLAVAQDRGALLLTEFRQTLRKAAPEIRKCAHRRADRPAVVR